MWVFPWCNFWRFFGFVKYRFFSSLGGESTVDFCKTSDDDAEIKIKNVDRVLLTTHRFLSLITPLFPYSRQTRQGDSKLAFWWNGARYRVQTCNELQIHWQM